MPAVNSNLPSLVPIDASLWAPSGPAGSGLHPDFFQPPPAAPLSATAHADSRARTRYRADFHESHAAFCRHEDFPRYQVEMTENLAFLGQFCVRHSMPDAKTIANRFDVFLKHRFEEAYFHQHIDLLDSRGKESLDNFCDMVRDDRIPLHKRQAAVRNLSEGLSMCASGATANLVAADRALALSADGIRATLWRLKEETARDALLEAVLAEFSHRKDFAVSEIHYVNAAWNYIADAFGLAPIPDGNAGVLEPDFLNACLTKVRAAMTADRLAYRMAEQCLGTFTSHAAARSIRSSGGMTAGVNEAFTEILRDILQQHGLEEDALGLHGFVHLDDYGERYDVRSDASLIARDVLKVMDTERLLNGVALSWGAWQASDGVWFAFHTFGTELAWMTRRLQADLPAVNDWVGGACVDLITMRDLLTWRSALGAKQERPPDAALRQAIRCADSRDLAYIPAAWLSGEEIIRELLSRNAHEQIQRCLKANFLYFSADCPHGGRAELVDGLMGKGDTILKLAREWYPDPWTLLGETRDAQRRSRLQRWMGQGNADAIAAISRALDRTRYLDAGRNADEDVVYCALRGLERRPALSEAMAAGHAKAVTAWHGLLRDRVVLPKVKSRLSALLTASHRSTALCLALCEGHADAIRAYHAILADSAILPHIKRDLPGLLTAPAETNTPGLVFALERGHAEAVDAYRAMLADSAILPHIARELPEIVIARSPSGSTGLLQALSRGRVEAINAYRALLADPAIWPHVKRALYRILGATQLDGHPGLTKALVNGHAGAVGAFHGLLVDPVIFTRSKRFVHKLVLAKGTTRACGLAFALEEGHASAVRAYHRLLIDPLVLPRVARILPEALKAKRNDGIPGLALALRKNGASAVTAYGDMLADAAILPRICHVLPDLLAARDSSGTRGLVVAQRLGCHEAIQAFRLILEKPAIAAHIGDRLDELRAVEDAPKPARRAANDAENTEQHLVPNVSRPPTRSVFRRVVRRLMSIRRT